MVSGAGPPENDVRNCVPTNTEEKGIFRSLNQMELTFQGIGAITIP